MTAHPRLHHMGYSVVRMPALPVHDWVSHARSARDAGDDTARGWQRRADSAQRYFLRPAVAEAIYIASPGFYDRLARWDWHLRSPDDRKMLASFERYLNRMCYRCTPFGMFSTVSQARLENAPGKWTLDDAAAQAPIRRVARIDGEALTALCESLGGRLDRDAQYTLNASLYTVGDNYRFDAWTNEPGKDRVYELAEIDRHPVIDAVVEQTRGRFLTIGALEARLHALAQAEDVDLPALIADLVDARVLLPALCVDPLSGDPTRALAAALAAQPAHACAGERLQRLDRSVQAAAPEAAIAHYVRADRQVRELAGVDPPALLLQVDAFRTHEDMVVDACAVDAAVAALDYLADRFSVRSNLLDAFCAAFEKRYGRGAVPLMEALDAEIGIGYGQGTAPDELLGALAIKRRSRQRGGRLPPSPFDEFLLGLVQRDPSLLSAREIAFTREDLAHLPPCTDGLDGPGMHALLQFPPVRSAGGGIERITVLGGVNPTGAVHSLSRFCHGDQRLHDAAHEYARQVETESGSAAVHAEISYLPQGRGANVLTRPPIWSYRINLVEPSMAPGEGDLPVSDLMLTVSGKDVQLWSRRLGKRVIPHLTSAHNPQQRRNLATYKFLAALQSHGMRMPQIEWGPLFKDFEYRPRLRFEKLVLAPARWHIPSRTLAPLKSVPAAAQARALRDLLASRRAPRRIELEEQDNKLVLDLDDALDLDQLARLVNKGRDLVFCELLDEFDDDGLVDGRPAWRHEVVVPLRRQCAAALRTAGSPGFQSDLAPVPATQALYVKLYGGHERLDSRMLPQALDWLAAQRRDGVVGQWFFIRYADPDWHLRLRVFPSRGRHGEVLAQLMALAEQARERGLIHRFEFTAYERELVRYGGPELIERNEALFCIDSELVARMLHGDIFSSEPPPRWSMAMVAIDALLRDFGLPLEQKLGLMSDVAASFKEEFGVDKQRLGDLYRQHARALAAAIERSADAPQWSRELWRLLDNASPDRRALAGSMLSCPPARHELDMVGRQVHMLCNRLFAAHGREYEVLVYDFLARAYRSLAARGTGGTGS
jgi:thiopeptide-type bacteriocin biosynthesis protein